MAWSPDGRILASGNSSRTVLAAADDGITRHELTIQESRLLVLQVVFNLQPYMVIIAKAHMTVTATATAPQAVPGHSNREI